MIAFLSGKVLRLGPNYAIIDCGGVGYGVALSVNSAGLLRAGEAAALEIYTAVKDDAIKLYGFASAIEKRYFEELIKINGVGAASALAILSAFTPAQLQTAILHADAAAIKKAPGIGPKTAQRLILELKDKIAKTPALMAANSSAAAGKAGASGEAGAGGGLGGAGGLAGDLATPAEEALAALIALGFKQDAALKALAKASGESASELVKSALKSI